MKRKTLLWTTLVILVIVIIFWWMINLNSLLYVGIFLFVTDKNKMNWIGLTGIIAIAGLIYNFYDGRRRFRGDIRSKSRIDWMKTVRILVAEFLSDYSLLLYIVNNNIDILIGDDKGIVTRLKKNYYEILLYVPDNDSNALLLNNIKKLYSYLTNGDTDFQEQKSEIDKVIKTTVEDASQYFKDEWEKAKKGN
ncbi:hypothetical protein PO181_02095 [Leuconostoc suionicum]|uniref:hypothetical protein n=1 Tax=Leuconostoc suionicum TaxID=1511761 RepID=UPI00233F46B3|nr:hypothetical protein [Leuconostoc suionicum]MDC2815794.1 hypothetical protein [Leuconostoc suionicum]